MHAGDGLLGVEREPAAAGKLHVDVRVRSCGFGNRQPQLPVEPDRTADISGEYLDDCRGQSHTHGRILSLLGGHRHEQIGRPHRGGIGASCRATTLRETRTTVRRNRSSGSLGRTDRSRSVIGAGPERSAPPPICSPGLRLGLGQAAARIRLIWARSP